MKSNEIKRVNITLPQKTLLKLNALIPMGNRSQFIDTAINYYVNQLGRKNLRAALKKGAQTHANRDLDIAHEWASFEE